MRKLFVFIIWVIVFVFIGFVIIGIGIGFGVEEVGIVSSCLIEIVEDLRLLVFFKVLILILYWLVIRLIDFLCCILCFWVLFWLVNSVFFGGLFLKYCIIVVVKVWVNLFWWLCWISNFFFDGLEIKFVFISIDGMFGDFNIVKFVLMGLVLCRCVILFILCKIFVVIL